jgi:hypothetical protein
VDPQHREPQDDDQAIEPSAVASLPGRTHHRHDLIHCRRIGRVALTFVARRFAGVKRRHRRGRAAPASGIDQRLDT